MIEDECKKCLLQKAEYFHYLSSYLEVCIFLIVFNKFECNFPPSNKDFLNLTEELYKGPPDVAPLQLDLWKKVNVTATRGVGKNIRSQASDQLAQEIKLDDFDSFIKLLIFCNAQAMKCRGNFFAPFLVKEIEKSWKDTSQIANRLIGYWTATINRRKYEFIRTGKSTKTKQEKRELKKRIIRAGLLNIGKTEIDREHLLNYSLSKIAKRLKEESLPDLKKYHVNSISEETIKGILRELKSEDSIPDCLVRVIKM